MRIFQTGIMSDEEVKQRFTQGLSQVADVDNAWVKMEIIRLVAMYKCAKDDRKLAMSDHLRQQLKIKWWQFWK